MSHSSSLPVSSSNRTELDLLHALLNEDGTYPWQPHAPENEAYFSTLDSTWDEEDMPQEALQGHWQALANQAAQLWGAAEATPLLARLSQRFGSRVPQGILSQLAQQVQTAAQRGGSLLDQLVLAVDDVLDQWDSDDLRVMARPLAMAMRDGHGDILEATLRSTGDRDWSQLSDVEKARLGLAIARYGFDQLDA
ncbi:MAG: hypothetical protein O3C67_13105 [Cyanobacteria bacterium]|nr:hypothetical protein [Cyanobacteriota bacterium]